MTGGGGGSVVIFCLPVVIFWVDRNLSSEMVIGNGDQNGEEDDGGK